MRRTLYLRSPPARASPHALSDPNQLSRGDFLPLVIATLHSCVIHPSILHRHRLINSIHPLRPIYGCIRDTKATAFAHTTTHPSTLARAHAVTAVTQPARLARMPRFYLQGRAHAYTPLYTQAYARTHARTHSPLLIQLHPRMATQREESQGGGKMGSWGR